ncbi:hypothetical protein [Streptomyces lanatus]|uniref:Uncharacterized protein n=1 Tax=Streptomyces lanatus TaxID=66900 RepID=A0ABV1Y813_9ACTN|nr:hypothetical protein [Streptomyces lanatus]GHH31708.1 hypothetical protein GCM10018780_92980 [Streptomyces lanatus]
MHSDTHDQDHEKKPSRREVLARRARRMLRLMRRRFLLGLAYGAGTSCVTLAVLWLQR